MYDDLISRQAAIDAHYEYCNKHPDAGFPVWSLKILEDLPSAQPDSKELSFTHKALDTISRQDAIRIVDGIDTWQAGWRGDAIESMKALPSAQPEIIRCNACKHWTQTTGNMRGFGLGDCDYINAKLVNCNGFCYWAERRTDE